MQISSFRPYCKSYNSVNKSGKMFSNTGSVSVLKGNVSEKDEKSDKQVSFGSVFIEDVCRLGKVSQGEILPKPLERDALLLNRIAQEYPNQDCFIMKGHGDYPRLEYREKPPEVQIFTKTPANSYVSKVDADDPEYPPVQLILRENSTLNRYIGLPSFISLNPSLPYTVKAGYEVHKKLLERKIQIDEKAGDNDIIDFGDETVMNLAHKSVEEVEVAVTRYLLECSYAALSDKVHASQLYASNYPKVQPKLMEERRLDIITSAAKQHQIKQKMYERKNNTEKNDICEIAMKNYPNIEENKARIDQLIDYMEKYHYSLL